eukprot:11625168-Prorocentrum_lima.AAC.1
MTSSLVGSGDVYKRQLMWQGRPERRRRSVAALREMRMRLVRCAGLRSVAVSYTHLTLPTICSV